MKLVVRMREWADGQVRPLLCDETGYPLPKQKAATIDAKLGEATLVTVTFVVDGDYLKIEASK